MYHTVWSCTTGYDLRRVVRMYAEQRKLPDMFLFNFPTVLRFISWIWKSHGYVKTIMSLMSYEYPSICIFHRVIGTIMWFFSKCALCNHFVFIYSRFCAILWHSLIYRSPSVHIRVIFYNPKLLIREIFMILLHRPSIELYGFAPRRKKSLYGCLPRQCTD